jgi:peptide-methionine (S)-S-oxide reductase
MIRRAAVSLALSSLLALPTAATAATAVPARTAVATFAMGCFWCAETAFEGQPGVLSAVSGYTGGREANPTYDQVSNHATTHYEALQVTYDPARTRYETLLDLFWHNIDPTQGNGQFCDHGDQYRSAVFTHDEAQRRAVLASKAAIEKSGVLKKPIVTAILPAARFWPAEDYHQDFYKKSPARYQSYRRGCGRDARLRQLWGERPGGAAAH